MPEDHDHFDKAQRLDAAEPIARLSAWTKSGAPLPVILRTLAEETSGREARALMQLAERVEAGESLEQAFAAVGAQFPTRLRRPLSVAAESGNLASMLPALSALSESSRGFAHQAMGVLAYPALVLLAVTGLSLLFSLYVAPQFEGFFDSFLLDQAVLTSTMLCLTRQVPWLALAALVMALSFAVLWRVPATAPTTHWLATGLPLLGRLWIVNGHRNLVCLLSACTAAGMPVAAALRAAAAGLGDQNLANAARGAADRCESGDSLSHAMASSKHFERSLAALVAWGENAGALPAALAQATRVYDSQTEQLLNLLRRVAPPMLLAIVILFVLLVMLSLLQPQLNLIRGLC